MKTVIVGKSFQSAIKYFDELIGELKFKDIKTVRRSLNDYYAELTDGDTYQIIRASDSSRGYKVDKAYVQYGVDHSFIENILIYILSMSCLPENERIDYFTD